MTRPQVTITLGRSGQRVVKRPLGGGFDGFRHDPPALSGSKRYVEHINADDSFSHNGKRLQVSVNNSGSEYSRRSNVGENDLRLKLLRKRMSRQIELDRAQQKKQKISRSFHSSEAHGRILSRNEYDSLARRAGGSSSRAPGRFLSRNEYGSLSRRAGDSRQMESGRTSYSSSTLGLRSRSQESPERFSGGMSLAGLGQSQMLQRPPPMQPVVCRTGVYQLSYETDPSPLTFIGASTRTGLTSSNPSSRSGLTIAAGSSMRKGTYLDEYFTVGSLLNALGLGKYAIIFEAEEVDIHALKQMGDRDLKEIGIPMGPRKKIMLALMAQHKRQAT